jgi:hypothetical protein
VSAVREHLQAIYERRGILTPEIVVEEARAEDHPLHGLVFDRPPDQAAEAWYRERAHELIREVRVTYRPTEESEEVSVRAFHSVRTEAGYHYEPAEKVATDPFLMQIVLRDMERDWRQLEARYGHFQEFVELIRRRLDDEAA